MGKNDASVGRAIRPLLRGLSEGRPRRSASEGDEGSDPSSPFKRIHDGDSRFYRNRPIMAPAVSTLLDTIDVPEGVPLVIGRRLDRLGDGARSFAKYAARLVDMLGLSKH